MEYPNSGALFTSQNKKFPKAPDMFGDIKIELDLLKEMVNSCKTDHVVLKLGGWLGKDKNNNRMVSLKLDTYNPSAQQQSKAKDPWDD